MSTVALSNLTLDALRKSLTFDREIRLRTSKVQSDSLLGGGGKSVITAEKECLDSGLALFDIRTTKEGRTVVSYVRITSIGIERLLDSTPAEEFSELLRNAAPANRTAIQTALVTVVKTQMTYLDSQRSEIAFKESALLEQFRNVVESRLASLRSETSGVEIRKQYFEDLLKPPPMPLAKSENDAPTPKPSMEPPRPANEVEANYQRRMCDQLAEEYNEVPASRDAIERVFYITGGMDTFGERDSIVIFDGRFHHGIGKLQAGSPCRIRKPGWIYRAPSGEENVLVKAEVEPDSGGRHE